jgi:type II secretory pathway pseudopilin PulG
MKKFYQIQRLRKQRGYTLVELGIVVAFIAIAVGIGFGVYLGITGTNNATNESKNLNAIASKMHTIFAGQHGSYTCTTNCNATMIAGNGFPAGMLNAGAPVNAWGGAVTVLPTSTMGSGFEVDYAAVPTDGCMELVAAVTTTYTNIKVGATQVENNGVVGAYQTACQAAASQTIAFNAL